MNLDTTLRRALIIGLCAIPFIPLIVANPLFFPFITGKNFAFRILVEILFAIWAILALRDPSMRPRWSSLPVLMLAFLLSIGVSAFLAENPAKAFWSNFERMEGWIGLFHSTMYFFILWLSLNSEKVWQKFWSVSVGVAGAIGVFGFFQLAGIMVINQGGVRVDGTFGNATYLAVYMLFHVFISLWLMSRMDEDKENFWYSYWVFAAVEAYMLVFFQASPDAQGNARLLIQGVFSSGAAFAALALPHIILWGGALLSSTFKWLTRSRIWLGIVAFLSLAMIFYSATRGTILGLVGGLFVTALGMLFLGKGNPTLKKWSAGIAVALLVLVGAFIAVKDTPFVQNNEVLTRIASVSLSEGTTRFTIWSMAWKGFLERPIFGWGQEGFNYIFNKFYEPSLYGQEPWFDRAHNAFIDWLVAGGALGFLLYAAFYVMALWYIFRPTSTLSVLEKSLFTGLLAAYAFHNMFVFDNLISYAFFMTFLAYVLFRSGNTEATPSTGKAVSQGTFTIAAPAIVIVMAAFLYFANVPGIATASDLIQGLSPQCVSAAGVSEPCNTNGAVQDITKNFAFFKAANTTNGIGRQEAREQTLQFAVQVRTLNAGDDTFRNDVASYAAAQMKDEISKAPNDARLELFLGSFYRQLGDYADALPHITRAHTLTPSKQQVYFELGILANNQNDFKGAEEWFRQAYELYPAFDTARVYYAATALRAGDTAVAQKLLMDRYGTLTPDDDFVLQAYLDVKDFTDALAIAQARVDKDPNNAQLHVSFGAAYLAAGQRDKAVEEIQKAIDLNPAFKQQGEYYIGEIQAGRNP